MHDDVMNYIALSEFEKAWIFNRNDLPISDSDKALIKPMTAQRATTLWNTSISKQVDHPDFFKKGDWPFDVNNWLSQGEWEPRWESDEMALPEEIVDTLAWDPDTVVYYCNSQTKVIETRWDIFQRCWKNFLFMDDGALLIGKRRQHAVQFFSNGCFQIGQRP